MTAADLPATAAVPSRSTARSKGGMLLRAPGATELKGSRYRRRRRQVELTLATSMPILFVVGWQLLSREEVLDPVYFPAPSDVWTTGVEMVRSGVLQDHLWISLKRILWGFVLGSLAGCAVGTVMGVSRTIRAALDPLLTAFYTVPKLTLLPLFLLIFGLGETPKILTIAITVFFFMWMATMSSVISVPHGYRETAKSFGANRWQMFREVLMPAALPHIFVGLRMSIGVAVLTAVGIEFVQASEGIGWLTWNSWSLLQTKQMYVGVVVVAVLGVVLTWIIRIIGRLLLPWARTDSHTTDLPF